jgi:hypothetical protein
MRTKLIFTLAVLVSFTLQAQTFTYTGTGNWTDETNWSPSYPGDYGLGNLIINIIGECYYNVNESMFFSKLNISGKFILPNTDFIIQNDIYLNNGTLSITGNRLDSNHSEIYGTGTIESVSNHILDSFTINPGTESSAGNIHFEILSVEIRPVNIQYIFDIYSSTNSDTVTSSRINENPPSGPHYLNLNIPNDNTINHNDTFILFSNADSVFYEYLIFPSTVIKGFQPEFSFNNDVDEIRLTLLDVQAPTITNCPGDQNVTANCGEFYEVPDYTTIPTVTENSSSNTIIQSHPAGSGVKDGTIITLTVTDGAGYSSTCSFTVNVTEETLTTTEVGEVVSKQLALYPNPNNGTFTLENTSGLTLEYAEVIDIKGAVIQTVDLSMDHFTKTINLNTLSAGLYLFKIYSADGYALKKILIE